MAVTGWRSWPASGKACSLKGLWSDQGAHVWLFEVGWIGWQVWTGMRTLKLVRCSIVPRTLIGGVHVQAGLNPARGFFAGAKTGTPIPGARCRAWS